VSYAFRIAAAKDSDLVSALCQSLAQRLGVEFRAADALWRILMDDMQDTHRLSLFFIDQPGV
jgi:hypothetical protein